MREEENAGLSQRDASTVGSSPHHQDVVARGCSDWIEGVGISVLAQQDAVYFFPPMFCVKKITQSPRSRILVTCVKVSESLARCSTAGKGEGNVTGWEGKKRSSCGIPAT